MIRQCSVDGCTEVFNARRREKYCYKHQEIELICKYCHKPFLRKRIIHDMHLRAWVGVGKESSKMTTFCCRQHVILSQHEEKKILSEKKCAEEMMNSAAKVVDRDGITREEQAWQRIVLTLGDSDREGGEKQPYYRLPSRVPWSHFYDPMGQSPLPVISLPVTQELAELINSNHYRQLARYSCNPERLF